MYVDMQPLKFDPDEDEANKIMKQLEDQTLNHQLRHSLTMKLENIRKRQYDRKTALSTGILPIFDKPPKQISCDLCNFVYTVHGTVGVGLQVCEVCRAALTKLVSFKNDWMFKE